jgi:hypothetical protein
MAIILNDLKIDLTIKKYEREPQERVDLQKPYPPDLMKLKEKTEYKDISVREALKKLVEFVF